MARQRASEQAHAAFSRVGATRGSGNADPEDRRQEQTSSAHDAPTSRDHDVATAWHGDVTTSGDENVTVSRRRRGPVAAKAVALTVRFERNEALAVDELILDLRRTVGRRIDKSEAVRVLLRLARDRDDLRTDLATLLRDD